MIFGVKRVTEFHTLGGRWWVDVTLLSEEIPNPKVITARIYEGFSYIDRYRSIS